MGSKRLVIFLAIIALLLGVGTQLALRSSSDKQQSDQVLDSAFNFPVKKNIADFNFTKHDGSSFTKNELQGKWSLVFFGFTYCPDVCPTTLNVLSKVYADLSSKQKKDFQVVLFSVDPERDTPEKLASYIDFFNKDFIAVATGNKDLVKLTQSLGVSFMKVPGDDPENYSVDHTARIFLLDDKARRFAMFKPELKNGFYSFSKDTLLKDLASVLDSRSS